MIIYGFPQRRILIIKAMCKFIEDYLKNPSQAVLNAKSCTESRRDDENDELVYTQISSPEFRLYKEIVLS